MSNKTQLQTNNANLDALISRVNAAKDTAASLPEAGSNSTTQEWIAVSSLPTTYVNLPTTLTNVYYEVPVNCKGVIFREPDSNAMAISYYITSIGIFSRCYISDDKSFIVNDADQTGTFLRISYSSSFNDVLLLPIFA